MVDSFVLVLPGGANAGIFGAGVLTTFQEKNLYPNITSVYAGSAGAMNGAFFLTKNMKVGSTIYLDDLSHDFQFPYLIPYGSFQRYWNRFIHKLPDEKMRQVVDIDYVMNVLNNKQFNYQKLSQQKIPFYVNLLNVPKEKNEYVFLNGIDSVKGLRASVSIAPYTTNKEKIGKYEYIDGTIVEPIGLEKILEKHPNEKIVLVLNGPLKWTATQYIKAGIEAFVSFSMYGKNIAGEYFKRIDSNNKDIKSALKNPNILVIHPPKKNPTKPRTTDPKKMKITYEMGMKEAEKINEFLGS